MSTPEADQRLDPGDLLLGGDDLLLDLQAVAQADFVDETGGMALTGGRPRPARPPTAAAMALPIVERRVPPMS